MIAWLQIIVSNITVALLVAALAWMVGRSGRYGTLAHLLWIVFFVKLVTPPLLWIPIAVPVDWLPPAVSQVIATESVKGAAQGGKMAFDAGTLALATDGPVSPAAVRPADARWLVGVELWMAVAGVWIFGTLCVFVPGLMRLVRFRGLLRREGQADVAAESFVAALLEGVRATPRVMRLPTRISPMLFGFGRRAMIVCPDELWQSLAQPQRHALLAHETAHYFRRDHWVRWLEWVVTALYWWFPGVYLARHQLERHEEAACDAWAVQRLKCTPRQYAEALLQVVDFLNERSSGVPRVASGMHGTGILEQRLRLLMRPGDAGQVTRLVQVPAVAAGLLLCLVHPSLRPYFAAPKEVHGSAPAVTRSAGDIAAPANVSLDSAEHELPEPPEGFWNQRCRKQWANFTLTLPGARLIAEASHGIAIEIADREPLRFSAEELSAIAEIPATQRVVIGDAVGRVRLWDLRAGLPVSLVGRHAARVTSLAYDGSFGIISGDVAGSVIRWDLQSGQVLATWAGGQGPVQSVRRSVDGRMIAVLAGNWRQVEGSQTVYFIDASSLTMRDSASISPSTAVVLQHESQEWLAVEWSGAVRRVANGQWLATIAKHEVSALVLSQEANLSWPPVTPPTDPRQMLLEAFW